MERGHGGPARSQGRDSNVGNQLQKGVCSRPQPCHGPERQRGCSPPQASAGSRSGCRECPKQVTQPCSSEGMLPVHNRLRSNSTPSEAERLPSWGTRELKSRTEVKSLKSSHRPPALPWVEFNACPHSGLRRGRRMTDQRGAFQTQESTAQRDCQSAHSTAD